MNANRLPADRSRFRNSAATAFGTKYKPNVMNGYAGKDAVKFVRKSSNASFNPTRILTVRRFLGRKRRQQSALCYLCKLLFNNTHDDKPVRWLAGKNNQKLKHFESVSGAHRIRHTVSTANQTNQRECYATTAWPVAHIGLLFEQLPIYFPN